MKQNIKKRIIGIVSAVSVLAVGAVPLASAHGGSYTQAKTGSSSASAGVLSQSSSTWSRTYGVSFASANSVMNQSASSAGISRHDHSHVSGHNMGHLYRWYHHDHELLDVNVDAEILDGHLLDADIEAEVLEHGDLLDAEVDLELLDGNHGHHHHHNGGLLDLELDLDLL